MFERETDFAINAAKQAAEILKFNFRAVKEIKRKADGSMVSNADIAAENQIIELIEENYPEYNIIGEESGEKNKGSDFTFIIDPLDGTHNYIAGIPYYGISIGLLDREKPIMGVVLNPTTNELFVAEKGNGAFLNGEQIHASEINSLKESSIATVHYQKMPELFLKIIPKTKKHRVMGSLVVDHCYVALGAHDSSIYNVHSSWDVAATKVIVEEAGGKLTDFKGNDFSLEIKNSVCSNGLLHNDLLDLLK